MAIDRADYPNKVENNLWANEGYSTFFYNFMYEKKRYRGLIDLGDKMKWSKKDKISAAKAEVLAIKSAKKEQVLNHDVTLDTFIEKYFSQQATSNYTKGRKSHYERYVSPVCGSKKVTELRQMHVKNSIELQEKRGLKPRTIKQTLEVLAPAMKSAIANRLISFNPLDGIRIKLPKTKKMVSNASDELVRIHQAIYAEFGEDPFYLALFLFALQGRRRGEILTLRWEDLSFHNSYYILRNTKNNEEQKIFLSDALKENLEKFREESGWVFTSRRTGTHLVDIRKVTNRLKRRLKDDNFGIHYLRNVIVSAMAEQGFDTIHLSAALGHNDPNTIKKYLTMNYLRSSEMASEVIAGITKRSRLRAPCHKDSLED